MVDQRYNHKDKVYVEVTAVFDREGFVKPVSFVWENGQDFFIERIMDIRRAASLKAGGVGKRYTIQVKGKETFLFLEEDRWFMERK